jgi:aspartate/methionine/tyrosine aminotransferase
MPDAAPRVPSRIADMAWPPFDRLNARAAALRQQGRDIIGMGQAVPDFGPPASAIAAVREAMDRRDTHVYSADAGLVTLRQALVERLTAASGTDVGVADVVVTSGGNQAFMLAVTTLLEPGDEVIMPAPWFVNHEMAVRAVGAIPVAAPLDGGQGFPVRWRDIEPFVSGRTRAVVVCTPSNPTGATIDGLEGAVLVAELARRGILLLSDEAYMRFVYDAPHWSAASVPGWRSTVVVVGTFSKTFGITGWRVGYLLADRAICEQAIKVQDAMVICAPVPSQIGVEAAIRRDWDYPLSFHEVLRSRRAAFGRRLASSRRLRWTPTGGAFFGLVRVDGLADSLALAEDLLERAGVVTIPGSTFGPGGEGHLRLSYGSTSLEDLERALDRIDAHLAAA